ncbi:MAG: YciI family protein [Devosia sp.]
MEYALLFYEAPEEWAKRTDAKHAEGYWASWTRYMQLLGDSGAMRGGKALQTGDTKTIVKSNGSARVVEDGPFAEPHEELGGFVVVEAEHIDEALRLAEMAPCAQNGHVEVRPLMIKDM